MDLKAVVELLAAPFGLGAGAVIAVLVGQWVLKRLAVGGDAYASKKGENLATKEDFDQLLEQLKRNTAATESIRTELAHQEWTAREWKAARARKLEEFLAAADACYVWLQMVRQTILRNEDPELWDGDPAPKARAIQLIYFPELEQLFRAFSERNGVAQSAMLDIGIEFGRLKAKGKSDSECLGLLQKSNEGLLVLLAASHFELLRLRRASSIVVRRIYGDLPTEPTITFEQVGMPAEHPGLAAER
ncbi:hypothetical protein [Lysobacter enzymogenes]|uniref:hypothetical protein n=1 Tax=Lysobacter enzymogenes TaxID=69 RepID=UPI000F4D2530|nr:hypothetical protein [Lysobacter enzymogenes]